MCFWEDIFLDNVFPLFTVSNIKISFSSGIFKPKWEFTNFTTLVVTNIQEACFSLFGSLWFEEWYHVQKHWWWWQNGCAKNCQTFCRHLDCNSFCCKPLIIRHQRESTLTLRMMTTATMMEKWMISETHSRCIQSIKNYEESVGSLQQPLALIGFLEVCQFFPTVKWQSRGIGRSVPRGAVVHSLNTSVQHNQTPTPHPNLPPSCRQCTFLKHPKR